MSLLGGSKSGTKRGSTGVLIASLCALFPSIAFAAPKEAPRTEAQCIDQWRSLMTDPRPDKKGNGLTPDALCAKNKKLPANAGTCESIVLGVVDAYTQAENSVKEVCRLVPRAYESKCDNQGACLQATSEFQREYAAALTLHNKNVQNLIAGMQEMANLGIETSEQYAIDLRELQQTQDTNVDTETARRHGGHNVAEALRNHAGQDADQLLDILARARQSSTISQKEIEKQIKSPYVFEQLQATALALDQKKELEEYSRSLAKQQVQATSLASDGEKSSTSMSSVDANSAIIGSSAPSLLSKAQSVAGVLSAPTGGEAESVTRGASGSLVARPKGTIKNALQSGPESTQIDAASAASGGSRTVASAAGSQPGDTSGASRPGVPRPLSNLQANLRARLSQTPGVGENAETSIGRSGTTMAAIDSNAARGEKENSADNSGRPAPMTMLHSETESDVKRMVSEFEREAGRSPASEAPVADEIMSSESPSLFLRLKEVHVRCMKRGCVGSGPQKGKI